MSRLVAHTHVESSDRHHPPTGSASVPAMHDLGGEGRAVLFAHATGLHGETWRPVAAHLTHVAHSVAIDLRGHGDTPLASPASADSLHWHVFRDDVLSALEGLPQRPVGVGHSMGGAALLMAELARPGSFEQLVLFEPAVRGDTGPLSPEESGVQAFMVQLARRRRASFASREQALANFAGKAPLSQFQAEVLLAYVEHGFASDPEDGVVLKCVPETEAQVYAQSYTHGTEHEVTRLSCPVTIVMGSQSGELERGLHTLLAERLGTEPIVLDGVGHFGPQERPSQFATVVERLLRR